MGKKLNTISVLTVAERWFSVRGGISSVNRGLCGALARKSVRVHCIVQAISDEERRDAEQSGVVLIGGWDGESLPPMLPGGVVPNVVIGHGRVTGPVAKALVEQRYRSAARLHIVHTAPDEIEWLKTDREDDAGERAEDRLRLEVALAHGASRTLAIGPILHALYDRELSAYPDAPKPLRLDPGFDSPDRTRRKPPPGAPKQVLLSGRLEDAKIKGVDIAARAFTHAIKCLRADVSEYELVLRGAPPRNHAWLRAAVHEWSGDRNLRVTPRSYTVDRKTLQDDFRRATLVMMPSRAEAFGLVGVEAIVTGTPVLISQASGLGALLQELLPTEQSRLVVLPIGDDHHDPQLWGSAAAAVLGDPSSAFDRAAAIREILAERRTWAMAADTVLRAVCTATTDGTDATAPGHVRGHEQADWPDGATEYGTADGGGKAASGGGDRIITGNARVGGGIAEGDITVSFGGGFQ